MSDKKDERTVLAWIDLETTGLKPVTEHRILEYALVFTDLELNELGATTHIVPQNVTIARSLMDDYVIKMHTDNKLLEELTSYEPRALQYDDSVADEEQIILSGVMQDVKDKVTEEDVIFVIAGSTVGFDKGFIEHHMPKLFAELHYRQLDVSVYKVGFPEIFGTATSDAHRAMADIRASIQHHRHMRRIVQSVGPFVLNSPEL